jgi:hypothetical protein
MAHYRTLKMEKIYQKAIIIQNIKGFDDAWTDRVMKKVKKKFD